MMTSADHYLMQRWLDDLSACLIKTICQGKLYSDSTGSADGQLLI